MHDHPPAYSTRSIFGFFHCSLELKHLLHCMFLHVWASVSSHESISSAAQPGVMHVLSTACRLADESAVSHCGRGYSWGWSAVLSAGGGRDIYTKAAHRYYLSHKSVIVHVVTFYGIYVIQYLFLINRFHTELWWNTMTLVLILIHLLKYFAEAHHRARSWVSIKRPLTETHWFHTVI